MAPKNMKIVCGDGHQNKRSWLLLRPVFFKNSAVGHYSILLEYLIEKILMTVEFFKNSGGKSNRLQRS